MPKSILLGCVCFVCAVTFLQLSGFCQQPATMPATPGLTNAPTAPEAPPAEYKTEKDIFYYEGDAAAKADEYQKEKCQLDLYYPTNRPGFATVIWLHGGGLTGGKRTLPGLKDKEIALVGAGYRLWPKAGIPAFFEDAAAATAWTLKNIEKYGGDPKKVFIAGHSAGGYLAAMVGMDPRWLKAYGLSNMQLAGIIPVSGQVTTHFLVKKLEGDTGPEYRVVIDEYAPMHYASKDLPPICLITGDRRVEYKSRVEENELLAISLKNLGHQMVEFYEMGGLTHTSITEGGMVNVRQFVKKVLNPVAETSATASPSPAPTSIPVPAKATPAR